MMTVNRGRYRGLILDRDGVVNLDKGYVGLRDQFVFQYGIVPFLRGAVDRGYRLAIVTNQSGVARGFYSVADYEDLTRWYVEALRREGIDIPLVLACFELPDASVAAYARESFWRKPRPGMVAEAALRLDLDLARSIIMGDKKRDIESGLAAGVGRGLWLTAEDVAAEAAQLGPFVRVVRDFDAAAMAL